MTRRIVVMQNPVDLDVWSHMHDSFFEDFQKTLDKSVDWPFGLEAQTLCGPFLGY